MRHSKEAQLCNAMEAVLEQGDGDDFLTDEGHLCTHIKETSGCLDYKTDPEGLPTAVVVVIAVVAVAIVLIAAGVTTYCICQKKKRRNAIARAADAATIGTEKTEWVGVEKPLPDQTERTMGDGAQATA